MIFIPAEYEVIAHFWLGFIMGMGAIIFAQFVRDLIIAVMRELTLRRMTKGRPPQGS